MGRRMKGNKKVIVILGFIIGIIVVATIAAVWFICGKDKTDYAFTEEYVKLLSVNKDFTVYSGMMVCTVVNGHTYYFDDAIADEQRDEAISLNEKLIQKYLDGCSEWSSNAGIYFLPEAGDWVSDENHSAYINVDSIGTYKHIISMLKLRYGEYTNYGYLYALADQISHKLKWVSDEAHELDIAVIRKNPNLMNLGYIYFDGKYATQEEVDACNALSVRILNDVDRKELTEERFHSGN